MIDPNQTYFAAEPRETIGKRLMDRIKQYGDRGAVSFIMSMQALAWQYLHGFDAEGFMHASSVARSGSMAESTELRVNHVGALDNAIVSLVNQQKHTFEPRASANTSAALRAVEAARDVLDYYYAAMLALVCIDTATGHANGYGEGFIHQYWDEDAGGEALPVVQADGTTKLVRTGDVRFEVVLPWNVMRDTDKLTYASLDDITLALRRNRWNLVAKYPEFREQILAAPRWDRAASTQLPGSFFTTEYAPGNSGTDIDVFRYYHKKCAILPEGRDVTFLADGTVLAMSDLPVSEIPVTRISAGEFTGAPFGKTRLWDAIGMQQISDMVHSTIASSISTLGKQNVIYEEGTDPRPIQTPGGLNLIPVKKGAMKPEALMLMEISEQVFRYADVLKAAEEAVVGVNATSRGESPGDRASGSLAVFLDAKTLQQASALQTERVNAVQRVAMFILKFLNKYAKHPMKIGLAGRDGATSRESTVTGESLGGIENVFVSVGNPLTQSMSARIEVGNILLQQGADHDTVDRVLTTGQLRPLLQGSAAQRILIRQENEAMIRGEDPPPAQISDEHVLHWKEHSQVSASIEARMDPNIMARVIKHGNSHYFGKFGTDPDVDRQTVPQIWHANMLVLSGQEPPPLRQDLLPQPPQQGVPAQTPPPASGGPPSQTPAPAGGSPPSSAEGPKPPSMPKNPATGQRADGPTPTMN
jgi:hypothetical protein